MSMLHSQNHAVHLLTPYDAYRLVPGEPDVCIASVCRTYPCTPIICLLDGTISCGRWTKAVHQDTMNRDCRQPQRPQFLREAVTLFSMATLEPLNTTASFEAKISALAVRT